MTKLIAETACHHEGDYPFMKELVTRICETSSADIVKFHITLDLDEYMDKDHDAYETAKSWMFGAERWEELIGIVRKNNKELMLLLNDTKAIDFAAQFNPEMVEIHSVCLNVPRLQRAVIENIDSNAKVVIGIGGCSLDEITQAVQFFLDREIVLMFGFQNYPTKYEDVNLRKIRKIQNLYIGKNFGYADHTAWDEDNNELITLLVSANGMDFIEKHVTTEYGKERCDYSAAISIEQLNTLYKKIKLLENLYGDGSMLLNKAEEDYSKYGPMKMAAIAKHDLVKGSRLTMGDVHFCRTSQSTGISQINLLQVIGNKIVEDVKINQVIDWKHISER
ncbi:MAG: N-acetylneuraminate synthase family protein [Pseudomonadota bacterium]|nr:N-acetylneuraminate synthase family protein [Pseudomonadota bacterium]